MDEIFVVDLGERDRAELRSEMVAQNLHWIGVLDADHALVRADTAAVSAWAGARGFQSWSRQQKSPTSLTQSIDRASAVERSWPTPFLVIPSDRTRETRRRIGSMTSALGGAADLVESDGLTVRVTIDAWGLGRLLDSPDVIWAERAVPPMPDDDLVRDFGGANYVELLDGFTGAGVVCEVVDGGLRETHADFASSFPILRTENSSSTSHGTSTYGVLFGDASSDEFSLGMMPAGIGLFSSYHDIVDRDAHLASLASPPYFGVLQSNSWGSGITRRYTAVSAEMDDSIFRHGVIVLQSQSNLGGPDSRPEAWAKNIISVGGVRGQGTLDRGDDVWAGYASTGPALDGRIKPDLSLFNDGIWTTADENDSDHRVFTGTSAATPAVAGHFGIMLEMWGAGLFQHQSSVNTDIAESGEGVPLRPSVAMAKALMINSARSYSFDHVADDLGRYRQGWGTPDLQRLRDTAARTFVHDESTPIVQGETWARVFDVSETEPELRITMVYDDPAGLPMAVSAIVNDLDLCVTSPSGEIYRGNSGLLDGPWSVAGGVADRVNTVENVFVETPEPGPWVVEVRAFVVNEDADAGSPEYDVPFALVAGGVNVSDMPALIPTADLPVSINAGTAYVLEFESSGFEPTGDGVVRIEGEGGPTTVPLVWDGAARFTATLSGLSCGETYGLRFEAPTIEQSTAHYPADPSGSTIIDVTGDESIAPIAGADWTVGATDDLLTGWWEQGVPSGGGLKWDPPIDSNGDNNCWLTDNRAGNSDVSNGSAWLVSPVYDLRGVRNPVLHFDMWVGCDDAGGEGEDTLTIEMSTDDGESWSPLAEERSTFRWVHREFDLSAAVQPGSRVMFRFTATDDPDDSITEAAIDAFRVVAGGCGLCMADFDTNGGLDLSDLNQFIAAFLLLDPSADFDSDGDVDLTDMIRFLIAFSEGCGF